MLTIPGRPQSRDRNKHGQLLTAAKTYVDHVRTVASQAVTRPAAGHLRLDIDLIYTSAREDLDVLDWPAESIPNADTAHTLAVTALVGVVVKHRTQFNPITVRRHVLKPDQAQELYGSADGATLISWAAET